MTNGSVEVDADTSSRDGAGDGVRPHELLEAALASCLNMSVRMAAAGVGIDPGEVTTTVELDREADRTTFLYSMAFEDVAERDAEALRRAAARCPVRETLSRELAFEEVAVDLVDTADRTDTDEGP